MFKRIAAFITLGAVVASAFAAADASAGERRFRHMRVFAPKPAHYHLLQPIGYRHDPRNGRYSGEITIIRIPGIGNWSYGRVGNATTPLRLAPTAKIIDIDMLGRSGECSTENGVCVIRP
jgi:hypothetical protein